MDRKTRWIGGGALAVALIGGGTGVAIATGNRDDRPLTGSALEKATAAALQHTGGGTVIETEVGDDGAAYGVEIRLDDGRVVEIGLDANFEVIGQESDDDGSAEAESKSD
ncbi:MAG: PepSY domain-containing protein [Actinomycetota bacterium]